LSLKKEHRRRIETAEVRFLRAVAGYKMTDHKGVEFIRGPGMTRQYRGTVIITFGNGISTLLSVNQRIAYARDAQQKIKGRVLG
jgi:hypothetical protein